MLATMMSTHSTREFTLSGHIFDSDGRSLCRKERGWSSKNDEYFEPGIPRFKSVGLDDDGKLCIYCLWKI